MTLTELKEYVQARRIVSELEIAMHFRVEPSVIEPMARRMMEHAAERQLDRLVIVNKIDAESKNKMGAATAGMQLPPGMKLPF